MKTRWKIGVVVGVAALIALGWILLGHSNEPRYLGKPVSYWFKEYYQQSLQFIHLTSIDEVHDKATEALKKLGTNALPYLAREALSTKRDTALRTNFYKLLDKLPASWHLPKFVSRDDIRDQAVEAIKEINPPAGVILPLVQRGLDSTSEVTRRQVFGILANVESGKELLIPCFKKGLSDLNPEMRDAAVDFLESMGPAAKTAIPELMQFLKLPGYKEDPGPFLQAAGVLGGLGPDAAAALPLLTEMFQHETNWEQRVELATALCQIDGQQTNALDFIVSGLTKDTGSDPASYGYGTTALIAETTVEKLLDAGSVSNHAAYAALAAHQLGIVGSNAAPAIPALLATLDGTNVLVWIEAGPALKSLGAPKESYLPKLEEKLKLAKNDGPRAMLALSLMSVEPKNEAAQAVLMDLIRKGSPYGRIALDTWNASDRPPREAVPILQEALKSGNASWRETATWVLNKIKEQGK